MPFVPKEVERDGLIADIRIMITPVINKILISRGYLDPDDEWESYSEYDEGLGGIIAKAAEEIADQYMKTAAAAPTHSPSRPPFPSHRDPSSLDVARLQLVIKIQELLSDGRELSRAQKTVEQLFESDNNNAITRDYCVDCLGYLSYLKEQLVYDATHDSAPGNKDGDWHNVALESCNALNKIKVIKALMNSAGLDLFEAKALVENTPCIVRCNVSATVAAATKKLIEEAGGHARII